MPNWVYNTVTVNGTEREVDDFLTIVGRSVVVRHKDWETGEWVEEVLSTPFTYHNIVPVPAEILGDYYTDADGSEPRDNWYEWNNRNWGVKWDASDAEVERVLPGEVLIRFSSPWGPPIQIFEALGRLFPNLRFFFGYEEEQGWGGEMEISADGALVEVSSWDIPDSHEDNVRLGRSCSCDYESDETYWFDDCPRPVDPEVVAAQVAALEDADELSV